MASKYPKTPKGMYNDINKRYFGGSLPPVEAVRFQWVEDFGESDWLDGRQEEASVVNLDGQWTISLNAVFRDAKLTRQLYFTMVHECLHIAHPDAEHGDKVWNREIRRLSGLGLLRRVF